MRPAIVKPDVGADHQVLDGPRDQHLAALGERGDAGADVDGDPADVAVQQLALPGVQAAADAQPQPVELLDDLLRTEDGAGRAVEGGDETVAQGLDLAPAMPPEQVADDRVVAI